MFRNREVAIRLRRAGAPQNDETAESRFEIPWEELRSAGNSMKGSLKKTAALGVLAFYGYILLDTGRQVAVARAENHHNH